MSERPGGFRSIIATLAALLVAVIALRALLWSIKPGDDAAVDEGGSLVVYCAHDAVFAEPMLREFEKATGIAVQIKFDTEASKSLGLVELIVRERERPRCDVFWNNEQLGAMRLAEEGLLEPYMGEGWKRMPDRYRDAVGRWVGFAGRMRVWIVNTDQAAATQAAIDAVVAGEDLSKVAIAKPLFGTTRTQYTVLWDAWGAERVKAWHDDWRRRGVREVAGNGPVANLVASGVCAIGLTDTDDYFATKDAGRPVGMVPYTLDVAGDERAIVIPNTAAIIRGTRRLDAARKLVDYLASEAVERRLAGSASRQMPLGLLTGGVDEASDWATLIAWTQKSYPLNGLDEASRACLAWLRERHLQGQ